MILHTNTKGEGEIIIFLHSGLQTGDEDFTDQAEYLKDMYKVVRPDLRGHGKSYCSDFTNYFEECAKDLKETLDHFGYTSVHIAGASIGALIGILFSKTYPDYVKSLTVSGILAEKPHNWQELHHQEVAAQREMLRDEKMIQYFNQLHDSNWRELIYLARDVDWYPFIHTENFKAVKSVPVLYIAGEGNVAEVEGAAKYSQEEHVHVSILPFAGHLVHQDQSELYTTVVEKFLSRL
ncbi:alpha/beta fold hydrolase [Halobacillus yeomjeoni]|uniref:Alpha/beta hydrolase n=1 Tax=Halobacillus yeomjeoni TaxID=311194 RepID=A0A931HV92_9BACI|nr:alpha/beta hydrolase [Halobacillus yeomjeoni]MBH0230417.1 alpha/beta hydrolase [Halobacillus yeomjeoni]